MSKQTPVWTRGYALIQYFWSHCHASYFFVKYKRSVKEVKTSSTKGQILNILGFIGHVVSVMIIQLCHSNKSSHRKNVNEWTWLCPFLLKQAIGWIWSSNPCSGWVIWTWANEIINKITKTLFLCMVFFIHFWLPSPKSDIHSSLYTVKIKDSCYRFFSP